MNEVELKKLAEEIIGNIEKVDLKSYDFSRDPDIKF